MTFWQKGSVYSTELFSSSAKDRLQLTNNQENSLLIDIYKKNFL